MASYHKQGLRIATDQHLMLEEARIHQSVSLAKDVNWLRVWEAARDRGQYWTNIFQSFFKLMTTPLFSDRHCRICDCSIPDDTGFFTHLVQNHVPRSVVIADLLADLRSQDSDPNSNSFHIMKSVVSVCHTLPSST